MAHSNSKRSNLNTENIEVSPLNSSGFDLTHKTKDSIRIGHRELISYEMVLSGDKMRIKSGADLQFKPTNGSLTPAMDLRFEHVFIPFRNVNLDYEDTLSFDKGSAWSNTDYPHTTIEALWKSFVNGLAFFTYKRSTIVSVPYTTIIANIAALCTELRNRMNPYFIGDFADELQNHLFNIVAGWNNLTNDAKIATYFECCYDIIRYFFGSGSYLDKLNLPILSRAELARWYTDSTIQDTEFYKHVNYVAESINLPIDVMRLRCIYADWFEMVRDSNLEPARSLPRYHKLTNALEPLTQILYCYLPPRYVPFGKDIWTTAQIDSPYRHVAAPIIDGTADITANNGDVAYTTALKVGLGSLGDSVSTLAGAINNTYGVFKNIVGSNTYEMLGLDLVALKRAQQARAWLLRNHVFGDEYQDYILAQYGVKLEDSRINKPFYLGGVSQEVNVNQTTNPTTTAQMAAGTKNNTMTAGVTTESFDFTSAENGVVLTWAFLVPAVTYEPYDTRAMIMKGTDFPQPIFGNDSEEYSFACELSRRLSGAQWCTPFGRHPYAHAWRGRVDENHGDFLDDLRPFTFLREFDSAPILNSTFQHCHVKLDFMVDTDQFNTIAFGTFSHDNFVVRKLPVVTDVC